MTRTILSAVIFMLASFAQFAQAEEKFDQASIRLEQNATDKDAEIVFEVTGNDAGLAALKVTAPDGRIVADFKATDSKMGFRHVNLESPEPKNDGRVQADFPAGEYTFTGSTVTGTKLSGKAKLSHKFPSAASIVQPRADEKGVPVNGLRIKWNPIKNLSACLVSIEQEKTDIKLNAKLSGSATTFAVPDGFLTPNTEYKLAISTVSIDGNVTSVETNFETASGKK